MHLYSLTLSKATAINQSVNGSFSAPGAEEIVVAKGKILQLLRVDETTGKLEAVCSHECFGIVRNIIAFRLLGMDKDFIVVGSDSGRLVVLDFDIKTN